jgi:undecaprenyl-diphosphatase
LPASPEHRNARWSASDSGWCLRANRLCARRTLRLYFAAVSRLGDGLFWYALMAAMVLLDGLDGLKASVHLAATGAFALLLYKLLKHWTRRPRPFASDMRIRAWIAPLDEFSFPSGHTLHAVAFTLVALAHYPMLAWLLIPYSASVALSRVVLGLHYPSDVAIGAALGLFTAKLSLWLTAGVA